MNVKDIVKKYLEDNGYDGLYADYCGCEIDDLFPCCEDFGDCEPGIKVACNKNFCEYGAGCDWHIEPKEEL